ncbi:Transcriptional activator NphR [compost metagenome]
MRFLISRRMERAKALLLETGEPVASVAVQAGYADLRHFNRLFKAQFGQTPGEFRKARHRGG